LPTIREGEIAKVEGEIFEVALFEQWLIHNPIEEYIFTCITIWPSIVFTL
jgi:hypothetical protein